MQLSRLLGTLLLVVGIVAAVTGPFLFAGSTQRACPGIDGPVYGTVGIDPAGAHVVGVEGTALEWYDGCNWRDGSLVPTAVGATLAVGGVGLSRRG